MRVIVFLAILILTAGVSAQEKAKYVHEFHHDFRGKPLPKELNVAGKAPSEYFNEEKEGFRITMPDTFIHEFGGIGVRSTFSLKGDFDVIGTFEILKADVPVDGFGVGCSLRVQQGPPDPQGATLARVVRGGGNQILMWDRGPDLDGKFVGLPHKCNDKLLRLRLKRVGGTLHYQWAPGVEGDNFQELTAQPQFGAGDVTAVRMSVLTGRKPCNVDVRLIELWVGSGGVRDAQDANAAPVPPPPNNLGPGPAVEITPSRSWMMALVIIGAVLLLFSALGAVGLVVLMKRRKPLAESAAVKAEPLVTFQCASCGKSLKAKSTASGKKLKCAQCGKAVLVP